MSFRCLIYFNIPLAHSFQKKIIKNTWQEEKKSNFLTFVSHFLEKHHLTKRRMSSVRPIHTKHTFGHNSDTGQYDDNKGHICL